MTIPPSALPAGLTINEAKRALINQFREAGLDTADIDARLLIMAVTAFTQTDMILRGKECLSAEAFQRISNYAARRLAGEPIDNILGWREFYGRQFKVNKDVLSPRPETEMLVDMALECLKDKPNPSFLDLGTGSGAIAISILAEMKRANGVAVDISAAALDIAKENAVRHNVQDSLTYLQGSWFEPVSGHYDIILSNPPYITAAAMEDLDIEVKDFDPVLALHGGDDGLMVYRTIISQAANYLKPEGVLFFEIGYDQAVAVTNLLSGAGFTDIFVHKDLSGHDRMIKAVI